MRWLVVQTRVPWLIESISQAGARRSTRFASVLKRADLAHTLNDDRWCAIVFAPPARVPASRRVAGEQVASARVLVYVDGVVCVVQVENDMCSEDWGDLETGFTRIVEDVFGNCQSQCNLGQITRPLFDEAERLADARECERQLCVKLRAHAIEMERERAIRAFVYRRACGIVARTVDAHLDQIKARLWHPDGRLVAKMLNHAP